MISREVLLHNGFEFRNWEDSNFQNEEHWTPEGEYFKRINGYKYITIRYSKLYKWEYEIRNCESHILISADGQDVIYIDRLQNLIDLAEIELILKRPDNIPLSDFHRSVDFAVIFDFGDNDFCIPMATAAEFYCDEYNRLLEKIDLNEHICNDSNFNNLVDDFNKLCKLENVKEVMKCGFMSERLNGLSKSIWKDTLHDPTESSFNKMRRDLDYIFGNDKKNRWGKVDGKYIVIDELNRLITGTHEEISTAILKYGEQRENHSTNSADNFPVWCNDEVLVLYMKDGFLTYMFR